MAFGWAGAAAGASDALQKLLIERQLEAYRQAQLAGQTAAREQDASQFNADLGLRQQQQRSLDENRRWDRQRTERMDRNAENERGLDIMAKEAALQPKPPEPKKLTLPLRVKGAGGRPALRQFEEGDPELMAGVEVPEAASGAAAQGSSDQVWVIRGGKPIPIPKGTAQPGDQPYDAVAARNTGANDPQAEAMDTAREVQRIARNLRTHSGLPGAFGVVSSRLPTLRQDTADAETLLNSLQGLLTIENMGKMKGVLSDADMRILRQASTTLDAKMSEPAARAELLRLEQVMSKLTGESAGDGPSPPNTGDVPSGGRASGAGPTGRFRILSVE